mgnify:CR=1 FL=1
MGLAPLPSMDISFSSQAKRLRFGRSLRGRRTDFLHLELGSCSLQICRRAVGKAGFDVEVQSKRIYRLGEKSAYDLLVEIDALSSITSCQGPGRMK